MADKEAPYGAAKVRLAILLSCGKDISAREKMRFGRTAGASLAAGDGGLAQLARAPALQAGGQRFESVILHDRKKRL